MGLYLPKLPIAPFLLLLFISILISCDRDLVSTENQPTVDYVLVISDSVTAAPLANVQIRVRTIDGDTATYFTDTKDGRAELLTVASSRTLFRLSLNGYKTLDFQDTVNSKPDTVFNLPVPRLLQIKMVSSDPYPEREQVHLLLRNGDLQRLRNGKATYTDSLGNDRVIVDNDSDGTVLLSGLSLGSTLIKVEHSGYLGRWIETGSVNSFL